MTTLDRPTLYDTAFYGEPLERLVRAPLVDTKGRLWTLGPWPIDVPPPSVRPAPDVQRSLADLRAWTGWSARQIADVLGTSHTTVLGIEGGRPLVAGHSGDLRRRIADAHDVVHRVFLLSDGDPDMTQRVLATPPAGGRPSPTAALRNGEPSKAYLAAVDVLRPRARGLLVGNRPRRGDATAPLHE